MRISYAILSKLTFIILFNILSINSSYAILDIEITKGVEAAIPIAIVPFKYEFLNTQEKLIGSSDLSEKISKAEKIENIVTLDLYRSGLFRPIQTKDLIQKPTDIKEVNYSYWRNLGVENVIIGTVKEIEQDKYEVRFNLVDIYNIPTSLGTSFLSKNYEVNKKGFRKLAHHVSDVIFESLTGIKGTFSTKIAYVNVNWKSDNKIDNYVLEVADFDGFNPQQVVVSSEPIMSPVWHPSGKKISYVTFENKKAEIKTLDLRTGQTKLITSFKGINGAPAWSPDGNKLALVLSQDGNPNIYILDVKTKKLKKATNGWSIDTEPRWLPSGDSIIFTSNKGGSPQIYKYSLKSGKTNRVTFNGGYNARGSVAADGKTLVMLHKNEDGFKIAMQNLDTGEVKILTDTSLDESPSLSPNGNQIIYSTMDNNKRILAAISLDGSVQLKLPARKGDVREPTWSPFL